MKSAGLDEALRGCVFRILDIGVIVLIGSVLIQVFNLGREGRWGEVMPLLVVWPLIFVGYAIWRISWNDET
jgi:hypothetical protein